MAFVAAATSVGAAVLGTGAAAGIGSTIVGGALIGAGVGGLYSAITGDGNILNSMLTGGLIGGAGAGIGGALAPEAAGINSAALSGPSTAAVPTSNVMTNTAAASNVPIVPAQVIAENQAIMQSAINPATGLPFAETSLAGSSPISQAAADAATKEAVTKTGAGLTGNQILGYGLGGAAALSLLGGMRPTGVNVPSSVYNKGQIRPFEYSSTPTPATGEYPSPYASVQYNAAGLPVLDTRERSYFDQQYTELPPYQAAKGGLMMANGGPVEGMSDMDQGRGMYPQGMIDKTYYATPTQRPASMEVVQSDYDAPVNPITGLPPVPMAEGGLTLDEYIKTQVLPGASESAPSYTYDPAKQQYSQGAPAVDPASIPAGFNPLVVQAYQAQNPNQYAYDAKKQRYSAGLPTQDQYNSYLAGIQSDYERSQEMQNPFGMFGPLGPFGFSGYAAGGQAGGEYNLGSYSDGGRLLKGPGDGMSDHIPAMIGKKQPARLADGEFVVPADVVSHLGNGSTDAGAKRLYAMMDKVRKARTGNKKQGKQIKAEKFLPA